MQRTIFPQQHLSNTSQEVNSLKHKFQRTIFPYQCAFNTPQKFKILLHQYLVEAMQYLPQANRLARILIEKKKMKITKNQIKNWCLPIRQLVVHQKVGVERINRALKWYSQNINKKHVSVICSGAAFRRKFMRLEHRMYKELGNHYYKNRS